MNIIAAIYEKLRLAPKQRMPDSIEVQLDIMIHRTQITERYPFTVVGDQS